MGNTNSFDENLMEQGRKMNQALEARTRAANKSSSPLRLPTINSAVSAYAKSLELFEQEESVARNGSAGSTSPRQAVKKRSASFEPALSARPQTAVLRNTETEYFRTRRASAPPAPGQAVIDSLKVISQMRSLDKAQNAVSLVHKPMAIFDDTGLVCAMNSECKSLFNNAIRHRRQKERDKPLNLDQILLPSWIQQLSHAMLYLADEKPHGSVSLLAMTTRGKDLHCRIRMMHRLESNHHSSDLSMPRIYFIASVQKPSSESQVFARTISPVETDHSMKKTRSKLLVNQIAMNQMSKSSQPMLDETDGPIPEPSLSKPISFPKISRRPSTSAIRPIVVN